MLKIVRLQIINPTLQVESFNCKIYEIILICYKIFEQNDVGMKENEDKKVD